jgi:hypothetical protein
MIEQTPDLMRRRVPLLFHGHFLWLGAALEIYTDSPAVLSAAEEAGFLPRQEEGQYRPELRWQIVSEQPCLVPVSGWTSKVTVDNNSLFLSMGVGQWFAFDFETGEGAGFVTVCDPCASYEVNAERYLLEIAHHVGNCLRAKLERSCRS